MLLHEFYQAVELHRLDKIIYAKFLKPHRVISTCRAAGGIRDGLDYVFNHQSCEPSGHMDALPESAWKDPLKYRDMVAGRYGLSPDGCATLGTAANMHNAAVAEESFRKHRVAAVSTGGVECNAGRVGEPASGYEEDGEHQRLDRQETPRAGTINTMLFIGQELTHGALVRSIVTATEAKAAALQELNVNSRYSPGLATGTGTDQIAVACLLGGVPLSGAGKHSKLGELIGQAVKKSVMGALALQNKLTPARQCSARIHLERFGADKKSFLTRIQANLGPRLAELLAGNFEEIDRDPPTAAASAALAHLWDKLSWGVLPEECRPEIMGSYAAQLAAAVSGKYERLTDYRKSLAQAANASRPEDLVSLACLAFALGFSEKWAAPA